MNKEKAIVDMKAIAAQEEAVMPRLQNKILVFFGRQYLVRIKLFQHVKHLIHVEKHWFHVD